jgi:phosphodiesterase/alkaline phosphatase D-like protein
LAVVTVRYGPDGGAVEGQIVRQDLTKEYSEQLTQLSSNTTYFVEVIATDGQKNVSAVARETFTTLLAPDLNPPLVRQEGVQGITESSAILGVIFSEAVEATVSYGPAPDQVVEILFGSSRQREHTFNLSALIAGTSYSARITGTDAAGNTSAQTVVSFTTATAPDGAPPVFTTGPLMRGITTNSARFEASLDEPADALVELSENADFSGARILRQLNRQQTHAFEVTDLKENTVYRARATVTDASNNSSTSAAIEFKTLTVQQTQVPPRITLGPFELKVDQTSVDLSWQTDQPADARVEYWALSNPTVILREVLGRLITDQLVVLGNLEPSTQYNYKVLSRNGQGLFTGELTGAFTTRALPDIEPPRIVGLPTVGDVKIAVDQRAQARIEWSTHEPADSEVRFRPIGGVERQVNNSSDVKDHVVELTGLLAGTSYSAQVFSTDSNNNGPTISPEFTFSTPAEPDITPPRYTQWPIIKGRTPTSLLVAFGTNEPTQATIRYGVTQAFELGSLTWPNRTTEHERLITGLDGAQTYFLQVEVKDGNNNGPTVFPGAVAAKGQQTSGLFSVATPAQADTRPPTITQGPIAVANATETVVEWSTDEPTDGRVEYTLDGITEEVLDNELRRDHSLVLSGLQVGQSYSYRVGSRDVARNGPVFSQVMTFKTKTEADIHPPTITDGPFALDVTQTSVTLQWSTDEVSTSVADLGTSTAYGTHLEQGDLVQQHKITIPDLLSGTVYHFMVSSRDLSNNFATTDTDPGGTQLHSIDHSFRTLPAQDREPPIFTQTPTVDWTNVTAVVSWGTDELSTSRVDWAGGGEQDFVEDNTLLRSHSQTVTGLKARTAYGFKITSVDAAGNTATWGATDIAAVAKRAAAAQEVAQREGKPGAAKPLQPPGGAGSFITDNLADSQFPIIINGPTVREKTTTTLTLEWDTDELADSFVRFGTSQALGEEVGAANDVLRHQLALTNLLPGQKYFYQVASTDPSGNGASESAIGVIATAAEVDLTPPRFAVEPKIIARTDASAVVAWRTDEASAAQVDYWLPGGEADTRTRRVQQRQIEHQVTLTNLTPNTEYMLRISATDANQNSAQAPQDLRLLTEPAPDLIPPQILADPTVVNITDQSATIRWQTDELADSFVDFDKSVYLGAVVGSPEHVLDHEVVLTNLEPAVIYHFRVGSRDRVNNGPTTSPVFSFTTLSGRDVIAPAVPQGLVVEPGLGANLLTWTANSEDDLAGYTVYREEGGTFSPLATNVGVPFYLDEGLVNGQSYRYRIAAADRQVSPNESASSVVVVGIPAADLGPGAPVVLELEQGSEVARPVVLLQNAQATTATLTYTIQVSTEQAFGNVVDRGGNIAEGATGVTRWRVERALDEQTVYWWRARAFDGRFEGEWSAPVALSPSQAVAVTVGGDFDADGRVGFSDFFVFSDGFGGTNPALDLDGDGRVGFGDFFVFADQFGQTVQRKTRAVREIQVVQEAAVQVQATAAAAVVTVQFTLEGIPALTGYGFSLAYDPMALRYIGPADSTALGSVGHKNSLLLAVVCCYRQ